MDGPLGVIQQLRAPKFYPLLNPLQFNRDAAEWTVVRKRARIAYFKHSNSEQETNLMNADFDIIETSMENDTLKEAIAQKVAEASNYAKLKERMASTLSNNNQATENGN